MGKGVVWLIVLITLICILLALAIFAGAFYLAKYVLQISMRNDLLEANYKLAEEHIGKQDEHIAQLNQEVEHMQHEAQLNGERIEPRRTWANDPLNVEGR
jgi:predicted Holliday junction resolvase-like endonuclease